ncbi:MAG TPA: hypothetical protein VGU74_16115 [Gemmatimonadales bacterium]|nr:hypothetical protein [Gemmatimonadales bacterium]
MRRIGDEEIEEAVVVVIKEHRGLRVADMTDAGRSGDILERAVSPVVPQHVATAGGGDEEIGPAVVVVIGECGCYADPIAQRHPGMRRHVSERPVAIVAIQGAGPVLVDEVDVVTPVIIDVADRESRAVIVEIDAKPLALLHGEVVHAKHNSGHCRAVTEPGPRGLAGRGGGSGRLRRWPLFAGSAGDQDETDRRRDSPAIVSGHDVVWSHRTLVAIALPSSS